MIRNGQIRAAHAAVAGLALILSVGHVAAQTYTVLHSLGTNDGKNAHSQLIVSG
jgi:hypothetical protein